MMISAVHTYQISSSGYALYSGMHANLCNRNNSQVETEPWSLTVFLTHTHFSPVFTLHMGVFLAYFALLGDFFFVVKTNSLANSDQRQQNYRCENFPSLFINAGSGNSFKGRDSHARICMRGQNIRTEKLRLQH